jgi:DNA repair protein RadC
MLKFLQDSLERQPFLESIRQEESMNEECVEVRDDAAAGSGERCVALPLRETPAYRAAYQARSCSLAELLAALLRGPDQLRTAYALLDAFGTLRVMANATLEELCRVEGMKPEGAGALRAALELGQRLTLPGEAQILIRSADDAAALVVPRLGCLEQEVLLLVLLNARGAVIGEPIELLRGSRNASVVGIGELFRPALRANADAILLAHNHPSLDPTPSTEDISMTLSAIEAGKMLGVVVLDHLVVGGSEFVSMGRSGMDFS